MNSKNGILTNVEPFIPEIKNDLKQKETILTEKEEKELSIFFG